MCTGISSRGRAPASATAALSILSFLLVFSGSARAQSLKLVSLSVPADVKPGSWVSYQVNVAFKNRQPRRVTQRLAVVSRDGSGSESGVWLELRTAESAKTRVERGFFAPAARGPAPRNSGGRAPQRLALARYQRLMIDGRLLEYPVGEEGAPMADDDISAMDLIEFGGTATTDTLAPDTLRIGRAPVPCTVERTRRYGKQDWQGDDTTYVNRAVMTNTLWRSAAVPVTGYARSVIEVSTERVAVRPPAPADTTEAEATVIPGDSSATGAAFDSTAAPVRATPRLVEEPPIAAAGGSMFFFRAEVTLLAQGSDAVPEITQVPEPAPDEAGQKPRLPIR